MAVIAINNLSHAYNGKSVLDNVSFSVEPGRILGIIGKNGAGKSTIINILNGFLAHDTGSVRIFGELSSNLSQESRSRMGVLFEGHLLHNYMTISQMTRYAKSFYPNWDSGLFDVLTTRLRLIGSQKIGSLSCGQRSQVALALILAQKAELLILDDFSMGLDPGYRRLFIETLKSYADRYNTTVLVTSHIIQDLEYLVDDLLLLNSGKVLFHGAATAFLDLIARYKITLTGTEVVNREALPFECDLFQVENSLFLMGNVTIDELRIALRRTNVGFADISPMPITLEDAFIGLTGKI